MPNTFKATAFFSAVNQVAGWTESWWTSSYSNFDDAFNNHALVINARMFFLSNSFKVNDIRISQLQPKAVLPQKKNQRLGQLFPFSQAGKQGQSTGGDEVWQAIDVKFSTSDREIFCIRQMRGIDDAYWAGGLPAIPLAYNKAVSNYLTALRLGGWGMLHLNRATVPPSKIVVVPQIFNVERNTLRKTGRPFTLLRGRARKRA